MIDFKYVKLEVDVWVMVVILYNMLIGVYFCDFVGKDLILIVL